MIIKNIKEAVTIYRKRVKEDNYYWIDLRIALVNLLKKDKFFFFKNSIDYLTNFNKDNEKFVINLTNECINIFDRFPEDKQKVSIISGIVYLILKKHGLKITILKIRDTFFITETTICNHLNEISKIMGVDRLNITQQTHKTLYKCKVCGFVGHSNEIAEHHRINHREMVQ
jgi:hypothetical protein